MPAPRTAIALLVVCRPRRLSECHANRLSRSGRNLVSKCILRVCSCSLNLALIGLLEQQAAGSSVCIIIVIINEHQLLSCLHFPTTGCSERLGRVEGEHRGILPSAESVSSSLMTSFRCQSPHVASLATQTSQLCGFQWNVTFYDLLLPLCV